LKIIKKKNNKNILGWISPNFFFITMLNSNSSPSFPNPVINHTYLTNSTNNNSLNGVGMMSGNLGGVCGMMSDNSSGMMRGTSVSGMMNNSGAGGMMSGSGTGGMMSDNDVGRMMNNNCVSGMMPVCGVRMMSGSGTGGMMSDNDVGSMMNNNGVGPLFCVGMIGRDEMMGGGGVGGIGGGSINLFNNNSQVPFPIIHVTDFQLNNSSEQKNENNEQDNKSPAPPIHASSLLQLHSPSKSKNWKENKEEDEEENKNTYFKNNYIIEKECSEFEYNKDILRLKKNSKVKFVITLIMIDCLLKFYCVN
jgi:hypothetical protein